MSQNPNMLRTMVGIGLTLIFVLGYAVYSNTVESEYYGYETTNTSESMVPNQDDDSVAEWFLSTNMPMTWVNVTVTGAPQDSILVNNAKFQTKSFSVINFTLSMNSSTISCGAHKLLFTDISIMGLTFGFSMM